MRTILITGCSSGFGLDLVKLFLANGDKVVATLRKLEERKNIFERLLATYGERLILKELDVTNRSQMDQVVNSLNSLDILINNAGYGHFGSLEDASIEQMNYQMEVNFFGPALLIKKTLPLLRKSKGKIFNISSLVGNGGMPLSTIYSASKFALEGLTEGLIYELAPFDVQVCSICPGGHRTGFTDNMVWSSSIGKEDSIYRPQIQILERMIAKLTTGKETPKSNVTKRILTLSRQKKIPIRVFIGKDAKFYNLLRIPLLENVILRFFSFTYKNMVLKRS